MVLSLVWGVLAWPCCCLLALLVEAAKSLQTPDSKVYAMQDGFPLQAARQAARSSTAGSAIGEGLPAGWAFTGAAWVPTWVVVAPVSGVVEPVFKLPEVGCCLLPFVGPKSLQTPDSKV